MTLRTRLFLIVGGLVSLLVGAEWALVTSLTDDLEQETGTFALQVGGGVLGTLLGDFSAAPLAEASPPPAAGGAAGRRVESSAWGWSSTTEMTGWVFTVQDEAVALEGSEAIRVRTAVPEVVWARRPPNAERSREEGSGRFLRISMRSTQVVASHGPAGVPEELFQGVDEPAVGGSPEEGAGRTALVVLELADAETPHLRALAPSGVHALSTAPFPTFPVVHSGVGPNVGPNVGPRIGPRIGHVERVDLTRVGPVELAVAADSVAPDSVAAGSFDGADQGDPVDPTIEHSIPIPHAGFREAVDGFLGRLWLGTVAIFGLGLVVAGWVAHRVSVPLRRMARAAAEVGDGALGTQVPVGGDREVASTLSAFNRMSSRLRALDDEARALREREHLTEIGEVARGLAHAMRNPLHLLGLSVEQLAARAADDAGASLAESARGQIQRVDRSLRTFLSLSSGAGGASEELVVDDLARDVALELLQDGGGPPVRVETDPAGPTTVRGVAPELRAVLHVLVVNAAEAAGAAGEVLVRVRRAEDGVRVEVEDDGPGLAPHVRERLFTPHLTTKEQGAGMGLFLAQRIASSRYAGQLALEPRAPRGTRAELVLHDRTGDLHG